jgi:hypothetical protein
VLVVDDEAQWLDKMELDAGSGAEPRHVAGIRRDFRMIEDDMEHSSSSKITKNVPAQSEDARKDGGKPRRPLFTSAETGSPAGDQ